MSNRKKGLSTFLGLVATGIMSASCAYAQYDVYSPAPAPAPVSHGCSDCQGGGGGGGLFGCPAGVNDDPWTLFGRNDGALNIGGWFSAGYHSESNDLFNSHPNGFNLHQGWLFVEKAAEAPADGGVGFGFRFDGVFGVDGPDTQSFGNSGATFDLDPRFTRGAGFGWAIPQAYGEVAWGDWNVKVGHFYTLVGWEVVTAPDNFFYSHSITSFNTEPFTHTGAIASYSVNDDTTIYGGWTAGWDSGFDFAAGSNFLGGFSRQLNEDTAFTYITTFGDFGARSAGNDDAYSHSLVLDMALTDNLQYIVQSDLLRIASTGEDNVGLNQYWIYNINDCTAFGTRMEWWKGDDITGYAPHGALAPTSSHSYYAATFGINRKLSKNITIRPEYRFDWSPALDYDEGYFGMDVIATF